MGSIFSFCNQKGGVGKTTSVINLSTVLAQKGYRVLVIDLDSQGNATSGFGVEKPHLNESVYQLIIESTDPSQLVKKSEIHRLEVIGSNADLSGAELDLMNQESREYCLKRQLEKIQGRYDFIFIDCPPSLGLLTINALVASNYVIIPLQCEYYALEGLALLLHTYQLVKKNLHQTLDIGGVILTMADFRTNLTHQVIEEVKNYFHEKTFETIIPRSVKLSEAPSFGKPAVIYDPASRGSVSYAALADEFASRFGPGAKQTDSNDMIPSEQVKEEPVENVNTEPTNQAEGTV